MTQATLSGRYEIGERIGSGGMSNVYRATDLILDRTVAVKVLAEHLSYDERFVVRFRRESIALARLIHPNVVQVYDAGMDDGRHYITMELVEGGRSCADLLKEGPITLEVLLGIVSQVAVGLDYAHRRGIVHRDVKPSNLLIVGSGSETIAKVTDFGIARVIEQTRIDPPGSTIGTRGYICPEAWWDHSPTPKFDTYALGVVAHQLAFGALPVRNVAGRIVAPTFRGAAAGEVLLPGLVRALADDPGERFDSPVSFAEELVGSYERGKADLAALTEDSESAALGQPPSD